MKFKRKIYEKLLKWKREENGATAVLIEGARRVGKTTIVREFAEREYRSYIMIDFNNPNDETLMTFEGGLGNNIDRFFNRLQLSEDVTLYERESVIVFDEVQNYPKARQMIKYLVADGRYDYIETGSLISLRKNTQNITIPSEEKRIMMRPMDFEEFLWAKGDTQSIPFIKGCFENREPLEQAMHRLMLNRYREYMAVGGMPQVVSTFLEKNDYGIAEDEKNQIWKLYEDDVEKIPKPNNEKVSAILSTIPSMLWKKDKKFSPGAVDKGTSMNNYESSLEWLSKSQIVNICKNTTDPSPIMVMDLDRRKIKTYLFDTGMLISKTVKDNKKEKNQLYKSLIFGKLSINEGMFFENMVAQELVFNNHELFFYVFKNGVSNKTNEIDFLLSDGKYVIPVEVKSSYSKKHASLDNFLKKYNERCKCAYVIHDKDLEVDGKIIYIPIYMTMFL